MHRVRTWKGAQTSGLMDYQISVVWHSLIVDYRLHMDWWIGWAMGWVGLLLLGCRMLQLLHSWATGVSCNFLMGSKPARNYSVHGYRQSRRCRRTPTRERSFAAGYTTLLLTFWDKVEFYWIVWFEYLEVKNYLFFSRSGYSNYNLGILLVQSKQTVVCLYKLSAVARSRYIKTTRRVPIIESWWVHL
jgi:hypothetical protein